MKSQLRKKTLLSKKKEKNKDKIIAWIGPKESIKKRYPEAGNFIDYLRDHRCSVKSQTILDLLKSRSFAPKYSRIIKSKIGKCYVITPYFDELCQELLKKIKEIRLKKLRDVQHNNNLIKLMKVDLEASGCPINLSYGLAKQLITHYHWFKGAV